MFGKQRRSHEEGRVPEALRRAIADAVIGAQRDDTRAVEDALDVIERFGASGVFTACGAWAMAVAKHDGLTSLRCQDGCRLQFGFQLAGEDGATLDPDAVTADERPLIWAVRFITAALNDNIDHAWALLTTLPDPRLPPGEGYSGVFQLLSMAARTGLGKPPVEAR